jgi:SMI1-KNR4 cell-wall
MRAIDKLLAKCPPPPVAVDRGSADDWPTIQERIGSVLPRDYKDFINTYGSVYIDNFWSPFNPFSTSIYRNLVDQMAMRLSALRVLKETHGAFACPYPLWFEPNGLLPWGGTENGDTLHWLTRGHPDQWTVIIEGRSSHRYEEFDGSMVEFVDAFWSRTLETNEFPTDFGVPTIVAARSDTK